jgi:CheY-like chemotaxis protein
MTDVLPNPGRTILLVDDEPEVLHLFKRILSAEGTLILAAQTGAEALEIARRTPLDLGSWTSSCRT